MMEGELSVQAFWKVGHAWLRQEFFIGGQNIYIWTELTIWYIFEELNSNFSLLFLHQRCYFNLNLS